MENGCGGKTCGKLKLAASCARILFFNSNRNRWKSSNFVFQLKNGSGGKNLRQVSTCRKLRSNFVFQLKNGSGGKTCGKLKLAASCVTIQKILIQNVLFELLIIKNRFIYGFQLWIRFFFYNFFQPTFCGRNQWVSRIFLFQRACKIFQRARTCKSPPRRL